MDIEIFSAELNGEGLRVGIVQSRFNEPICVGLREACLEELGRLGVSVDDVADTVANVVGIEAERHSRMMQPSMELRDAC